MQNVSIIGVGRVGGALALALPENDFRVTDLVARNSQHADLIAAEIEPKPKVREKNDLTQFDADIVFITTQDSEIKKVVHELKEFKPQKETFVFHTSGSLSSDVLGKLSEVGYCVGSIHPLVSISDSRLGVERFRGAFFCVEGENRAVALAEEIARKLGGKSFSIDTENKALYHASAVTACGHLVALLDTAFRMFVKSGVDEDLSKEILMPLIRSTINNLENQTSSEALTGTFDRVDLETFERHIEAMKGSVADDDIRVYLRLGAQSLKLVEKDSKHTERLEQMKERLKLEESALRKAANGE